MNSTKKQSCKEGQTPVDRGRWEELHPGGDSTKPGLRSLVGFREASAKMEGSPVWRMV